MVKILFFCSVLVVKVIVFVNFPILLVSYFTPILALDPGRIGSFGKVGTVHPHDPLAFEMMRGAFP